MNKNDQVTDAETRTLLKLAEQCLSLEGDFVELGCYKGETSVLLGKLLASCGKLVEKSDTNCGKFVDKYDNKCVKIVDKTQNSVQKSSNPFAKHLWIYDSFAGLPAKTTEDTSSAGANFQGGELFVTKREVADKIRHAGLKNVIIKKAWFEELSAQDLPEHIAFAFLDGDFYASIKTSLKLVVPLMHSRGIIVAHDYNNPQLPGASRAVDEFLRQNRDYQLTVQHTLAILRQR